MAIHTSTRTIHTIHIDVPDDALERINPGDEVEVVLTSRNGSTSAKKLTYRDADRLLLEYDPRTKKVR